MNFPRERINSAIGETLKGGISPAALDEFKKIVEGKFDKVNKIIWALGSVIVLGFLTLVIMVAAMVIDAFHFNSVVYKEYSQKTTSFEAVQKVNQELLNQIKDSQQMIIDLKKQLLQKK